MRTLRTTSRKRAVATAWVPAVVAAALVLVLSTPAVALPGQTAGDGGAAATWAGHSPATAPPGRTHAAMGFDPATGTTVLFGGVSGGQVLGDTWMWDGTVWTAQLSTVHPPPLESAGLVYDSGNHRLLLFGGKGIDGVATNATWSWDGTAWLDLNPAGSPPPRYGASLAPEATNGTVLLFGGLSAPATALNDTWTWNGANWSQAAPTVSPPPRGMAAATLDVARGVVVLFGGTSGSAAGLTGALPTLGDTWTWDGASWESRNLTTLPWPRADATMAYDPVTKRAVLFGGVGPVLPFGDTWLWDGTSWSLSGLGVFGPPARSGASLAGAPGSQRLVLFGGLGGIPDKPLDDTWSFAALPAATTSPPSGATSSTVTPTTVRGSSTTVRTPGKPAEPPRTSPGATPTAVPNPVRSAPLAVTARTIGRGGLITLSGGGFAANAIVDISLRSSTTFRTQVTTDADGNFQKTVEVPSTVSPGAHQIEARGPAMGSGVALTLIASIRVTGPGTRHGWALPVSMVALTVLLAGAAGVVLTGSARWPRHPSTPSRG